MPREGHDPRRANAAKTVLISIHVPREGHDANYIAMLNKALNISIHVPREGHDASDPIQDG